MRLLNQMISKLVRAIAVQRPMSNFMCQGCELREYCCLTARRRRLCCELRALRPGW
jgi:hypothetical protein